MLVLTRSVGEKLIIGKNEIKLTVLDIRGSQVRIGIEAPRNISVHREEIFERIATTDEDTNSSSSTPNPSVAAESTAAIADKPKIKVKSKIKVKMPATTADADK